MISSRMIYMDNVLQVFIDEYIQVMSHILDNLFGTLQLICVDITWLTFSINSNKVLQKRHKENKNASHNLYELIAIKKKRENL